MTTIYQVLADGEPWTDSDGLTEWPEPEAASLAELLETQGYVTELVCADPGHDYMIELAGCCDACGTWASQTPGGVTA